eukprot:6897586-Prymnesium_polylepis.2
MSRLGSATAARRSPREIAIRAYCNNGLSRAKPAPVLTPPASPCSPFQMSKCLTYRCRRVARGPRAGPDTHVGARSERSTFV